MPTEGGTQRGNERPVSRRQPLLGRQARIRVRGHPERSGLDRVPGVGEVTPTHLHAQALNDGHRAGVGFANGDKPRLEQSVVDPRSTNDENVGRCGDVVLGEEHGGALRRGHDVVIVGSQTQTTKFLRDNPGRVRGIVRHDAPRPRLRHFGHRVDGVRHGRGSAIQDTVGIDDEAVESVDEGARCAHAYTDPGDPGDPSDPGSSSGFAPSAAEIGPMRGNPASDRARNVALT